MKDTLTLSDPASACTDAEGWFIRAAAGNVPIPKSLVNAYVDSDVLRASKSLGNAIFANMAADGSCSPELMEAFRNLNTCGTGPTSLSPEQGYPFLDLAFDAEPPVVSGWMWLALTSLLRAIEAGRAVDCAMLQDLDAIDPWVGAYVRWAALMKQARTGDLDSGYLDALNAFHPEAAMGACKAALEAQIVQGRSLSFVHVRMLAAQDPQAADDLGKWADSFAAALA